MPEASRRLRDDEIAARIRSLPDWEIKEGKLTKAFTFGDFMEAVGFVNQLAPIAESEGHHPDLQVGWGRVVVELTSHDAGGLTDKDFKLASLIQKVPSRT
jgi:4a-hydroxytetrahydrobiopterin dehydratase